MSVNHQPAYFLKVLLVLRATFNLQSNLFSCFLWPMVPSSLVAFTHTSHTTAPTHASHRHPHPRFHQHPSFLVHPASKISQQIPPPSESQVAISLGPRVCLNVLSQVLFPRRYHTGSCMDGSRGEVGNKETGNRMKADYCRIPLRPPRLKSPQYGSTGIRYKGTNTVLFHSVAWKREIFPTSHLTYLTLFTHL